MPTINSKRFILRPFRKSDVNSLIEHINDKEVSKFLSVVPYPYTEKDAGIWIHKCLMEAWKKKKTLVHFAIDIGQNIVGGIDLINIRGHKAELGYWLGKRYWNKGIMTEAIRLVTNFGFDGLKLKKIYAPIFTKNKASARVLEKNGFKKEGLLKNDIIKNGITHDAYLYAKTK